MPTIYVDNQPYQVAEGQNLLQACLSLGFDLPYFCWHPAMHSVGACRQCAVKQFKDDKDTHGKIVMACMVPAGEGTRISIDDPEAWGFRKSVIEWLMTSHPHDCPVCDEGGECHLQDMTVMTGHDYRRHRFPKRTHRNQDLGPFLTHEMNRCIQCYRCVRFYRDYAGGDDLAVLGWHHHVYFGRHQDGTLESPFSGNLAEVCPTGVFTDKTLARHYTRKWDLQTAPSICVHCSLGCNTIPGERYGMLRRIQNRYHEQINGYFLCDRGRYGYEFVNSPSRIAQPMWRTESGELEPLAAEAVGDVLGPLLADRQRLVGIGSPRASLEANFALRSLVGEERFFAGATAHEARLVACALDILRRSPVPAASLQDVRCADAALVLGEDVLNTAPNLALALRQASLRGPAEEARKLKIAAWDDMATREVIQDRHGPVFVVTADATWLDSQASGTVRAAPQTIARLGLAVAHAIHPDAPDVPDLAPELRQRAQEIAAALVHARRPVVVSGTGAGSEEVLRAAAQVAWALHQASSSPPAGQPPPHDGGQTHGPRLALVLPQCNSLGLAMMTDRPLEAALEAARARRDTTLVVLECDLYRQTDPALADALLAAVEKVIVLDCLAGPTVHKAHVVLPSATFAESDGTLVNNEGRAQRFFQVFPSDTLAGGPEGRAPTAAQESWRWLAAMHAAAGQAVPWAGLDDVLAALAAELPALAVAREAAPPVSFRMVDQRIARQPHRYSGRTAQTAHVSVHEPEPPPDTDAPMAFSMEGFHRAGNGLQPPAALVPRFWAPGWNSVQSLNKFQQEVGGPLRGGPAGMWLISPAGGPPPYVRQAPPEFAPRAGQWLVVPAWHVFGSESLSAQSPGVAERAPAPYLGLNPQDARESGLQEGQEVELSIGEQSQRLTLIFRPALPRGLAALAVGLPGVATPPEGLPAWGRVRKVSAAGKGGTP